LGAARCNFIFAFSRVPLPYPFFSKLLLTISEEAPLPIFSILQSVFSRRGTSEIGIPSIPASLFPYGFVFPLIEGGFPALETFFFVNRPAVWAEEGRYNASLRTRGPDDRFAFPSLNVRQVAH